VRRSVFILENQNGKQGQVILEDNACTDVMSGEKFKSSVTVNTE
jgi:hypothetical protein